MTTSDFTDLLTLIEDRSAALRAAAAAAALDRQVPGCPDWSLEDLVNHLAEVQRFWGAAVAAGPATEPPDDPADERGAGEDLLAWSVDSTVALLAALDAAGPDRGCWTWWGAPGTADAVARHQVQEAAVHARDAQEAAGRPWPLPTAVARDEGDSWLLGLDGTGAALRPGPAVSPSVLPEPMKLPEPTVAVHAPASDLVLLLYGRKGLDDVRVTGDLGLVERLVAWSPTD